MANGENCPGCADQAEPIHGGGNRLMAFKPMGKRGPTVYRDMTGIDEAHIEKLSGIQPFFWLPRGSSTTQQAAMDWNRCSGNVHWEVTLLHSWETCLMRQ